ncbi:hypothetical protein I552_2036 [Mycobacterium xenopi 3993]|nr:hypothetical protein I552_2036 [Mycobacterium xenopi 3993]
MAKGYIILTEAIKDPEGMKAYGQAAGAAMGGVNILAVDTSPQVLEGIGTVTRPSSSSSTRSRPLESGMNPRPIKTQPSCGKRPPTATRSSSRGSRPVGLEGRWVVGVAVPICPGVGVLSGESVASVSVALSGDSLRSLLGPVFRN